MISGRMEEEGREEEDPGDSDQDFVGSARIQTEPIILGSLHWMTLRFLH